jgi:hypothetical protein
MIRCMVESPWIVVFQAYRAPSDTRVIVEDACHGLGRRQAARAARVKGLHARGAEPRLVAMSTQDETAEPRNPATGPGDAAPLSDAEQTRKDVSESPASETETAAKQADPLPDGVDDDIDESRIRAVPGTGGPDDTGDVELGLEEVDR